MTRQEAKELVGKRILMTPYATPGQNANNALEVNIIQTIPDGGFVQVTGEGVPPQWIRSDALRIVYVFEEKASE